MEGFPALKIAKQMPVYLACFTIARDDPEQWRRYGDEGRGVCLGFWAAVGAGIARIDFRRFIGYQFAYAAIWFVLGVLVFTLL